MVEDKEEDQIYQIYQNEYIQKRSTVSLIFGMMTNNMPVFMGFTFHTVSTLEGGDGRPVINRIITKASNCFGFERLTQ